MTEPTGPTREINVVTLATVDMGAAVAFYERLGFRLRYGGADTAFSSFHVGTGYLNLQLDEAYEAPHHVWGRIIICVDDVDAMHERVRTAGYTTETEPADASWGERFFHVRDPDGHELSFAQPLDA